MIFKYMLRFEPYCLLASKKGSHKFCPLLSKILVLVDELSKYLLSYFHVPGIVPRVEDATGNKMFPALGSFRLHRAGLET